MVRIVFFFLMKGTLFSILSLYKGDLLNHHTLHVQHWLTLISGLLCKYKGQMESGAWRCWAIPHSPALTVSSTREQICTPGWTGQLLSEANERCTTTSLIPNHTGKHFPPLTRRDVRGVSASDPWTRGASSCEPPLLAGPQGMGADLFLLQKAACIHPLDLRCTWRTVLVQKSPPQRGEISASSPCMSELRLQSNLNPPQQTLKFTRHCRQMWFTFLLHNGLCCPRCLSGHAFSTSWSYESEPSAGPPDPTALLEEACRVVHDLF